MNRIEFFEFEDFNWFPKFIRDGGTDFLGFILKMTRFYEPTIKVIENIIAKTSHNQVLDLCSGNAGPIEFISDKIDSKIKFIVSDKYPNISAYKKLRLEKDIDYLSEPLDILKMGEKSTHGIRTMFSAIHHFNPSEIQTIFKNIIESNMPICIFDSGDKHLGTIIAILLFHPILFLFCTPFIRPFRFDRLIFTYLIPIIPVFTIWDGVVSILRLYKSDELLHLAKLSDTNTKYIWSSGKLTNKLGFSITYLTGVPK